MDKHTLENLLQAYEVSPSAELAGVLVQALIAAQDIERALPLLSGLASPIAGDSAIAVAAYLLERDQTEQAVALFDEQEPAQAVVLAEAMLQTGNREEAARLYRQALQGDKSVQRASLDVLLDGERPRLKVVEKPAKATVEDISRFREATITFSDVVGLETIKKQINKKIILPFQKPSLFQRFKKKVGGGVLLYGPPGCGKTLLARATAGECGASFFNIEVSDVLDMYIGESESKLHAIFEKARAETPSVLFFDELEALAGKREYSHSKSGNNLVSQFLSEMDGFAQANEGILVLAATNVPWAIDPAFLRPGRFDRMFFVPPPDREARESILAHHMKGRPCAADWGAGTIAGKTSGYSGADLANLVEMAADEAIEETLESGEETNIRKAHLLSALGDSRATTREWLTTARNYARYANDGGRYDDVLEFIGKYGRK